MRVFFFTLSGIFFFMSSGGIFLTLLACLAYVIHAYVTFYKKELYLINYLILLVLCVFTVFVEPSLGYLTISIAFSLIGDWFE